DRPSVRAPEGAVGSAVHHPADLDLRHGTGHDRRRSVRTGAHRRERAGEELHAAGPGGPGRPQRLDSQPDRPVREEPMGRSFRLSRRTLLKGAGALMGLPFLEAMLPTRAWATAPSPK